MNFGKLTAKAKKLIGKRGGMQSVKEDAMELKDIATGGGSIKDKAGAAGEALKDPGAPGEPSATPADPPPQPRQEPTTPA